MPGNYICALDISSSKIAAAVAEIKKKKIANLFFEAEAAKGIKKGAIVNSIDLTNSLGYVLKRLKKKSGINIKFIYTNILGTNIVTKHSSAVIPLAERGNKIITAADIQRVNEQARILGSNLDEEIIHAITHSYSIDTNNNILNPLGLYSHRLEADLYLVCAKFPFMQALLHAANQAGYEVKELCLSGLAISQAVFNKDFQQGVTVLCDIGQDTTEVSLFEKGVLHDVRILTLGGEDLTLHLAKELKIPLELAEDIKRSYANIGDYGQINTQKEILIKQESSYKPISERLVCEILTSETKVFCQKIRDAVEKVCPSEKIDNFVATGRAVLLEGFLETLETTLGIPVKLGRITNPNLISWVNKDNTLAAQKYLTYLTCLGIICQALGQEPSFLPAQSTSRNPILKTINKLKEVYQEYF